MPHNDSANTTDTASVVTVGPSVDFVAAATSSLISSFEGSRAWGLSDLMRGRGGEHVVLGKKIEDRCVKICA
jgi:hypothetical protein